MSLPYGPVTLTANTMTFQDIDASAKWVVIENSSVFLDLGVSFYPNRPPVPVSFAGQPWAGVVQAGDAKRFLLPADGLWTGRVWLYPLNIATLAAATGTNSRYSRAYLTTFAASENPSDFHGIIRGLDLTSQPRIISLPMAATANQTLSSALSLTLPAAPNLTATFYPGNSLGVGAGVWPWFGCVIHSIHAEALTVGRCTISLQMTSWDNTTTTLYNATQIYKFSCSRAGRWGAANPYNQSFVTPPGLISPLNASASVLGLGYAFADGDGGMSILLEVVFSVWPSASGTAFPSSYTVINSGGTLL